MLSDIGVFHPQVVHFVIALLVVGVAFRWISLTPWARFTNPAAVTLIVAGTFAAVVAVSTGQRAHGAVERIPGAREAVEEHEEWGERTRNVFLVVALLEIAAVAGVTLGSRDPNDGSAMGVKAAKALRIASAVVGLIGIGALYEAGEHGGDLVYGYAGGVGTRSGDPADVQRLLVAGLYNEAMVAREAGRHEQAAGLIDQLARLRPEDPSTRFLQLQSLIEDRNQPRQALAALDSMAAAAGEDRFARFRIQRLRADAYTRLGMDDSAKAITEALQRR